MIPKVVHFYWGNIIMPRARYISIKSFQKFNPDWEIKVYRPGVLREDNTATWDSHHHTWTIGGYNCWPDVEREFNIINIESLPYKIPIEIAEAHKGDFLKWHLLADVGGMHSDMDVIYFKPLSAANINLDIDLGICYHEYGITGVYYHCLGLLLSSPNNPFFDCLAKTAHRVFDKREYQSVGSPMVARTFPVGAREADDTPTIIAELFKSGMVWNMPLAIIYPWDCLTFDGMWATPPDLSKITNETIGIHWYGGSGMSPIFQNSVEENKPQDNAVWWAIKRYNEQ